MPAASTWWVWKQTFKGMNNQNLTVAPADLTGKWIVISGGNNGIGREAALQFAAWGANIILACRTPPPTEVNPDVAVSECQAAALAAGHDKTTIAWWPCDMAEFDSVAAFAKRWLETGRPLDILVNNAGLSPPSKTECIKTKDGFELLHQVNFLSHTLMTLALLPSLEAARETRIVCTTSNLHYVGKPDLTQANAGGDDSYPNNKLYFQTWLTELQSRLLRHSQYRHITVHGVHPGFVQTGIWESRKAMKKNFITRIFTHVVMVCLSFFGVNSQQGSLTILHAATSPEAGPDVSTQGVGDGRGKGGARYWNRIWDEEPNPLTKDTSFRQEVWRLANEEAGLHGRGFLDTLTDGSSP